MQMRNQKVLTPFVGFGQAVYVDLRGTDIPKVIDVKMAPDIRKEASLTLRSSRALRESGKSMMMSNISFVLWAEVALSDLIHKEAERHSPEVSKCLADVEIKS